MREILFRGRPVSGGEYYFFSQIWKDNCKDDFVYGSLVVDNDRYYISVSAMRNINVCINNGTTSMIEVMPETVGQFAGLIDKNGKKIFEGDLLNTLDDEIDKMVVEYHCGCFNGVLYATKGAMMEYGWDECAGGYGVVECESLYSYYPEKYHEVIGNIYDNPKSTM